MKELKEKVFVAIGEASMCWKPIPTNEVFDSMNAERIGNEFGAIKDEVLEFFFEYKGRLYNRRLLEERVKQIKKRETNTININKRYQDSTKHLPENLPSYGLLEKEKEIEDEKENIKNKEIDTKPLAPLAERKSNHGGPDYKTVEEFFVNEKRPVEEAGIFWNEYEQKAWCVTSGNGPDRKMKTTRDWQLKAEQWIKKARLADIDKNKNSFTKSAPSFKPAESVTKDNDLCDCGCGEKAKFRKDRYKIASQTCYNLLVQPLPDIKKLADDFTPKTYLTKTEAIQAMKEGKKVRHQYFAANEYVEIITGNKYRFEDGHTCSPHDFWKTRSDNGWNENWSIFK